MQSIRAAVAHAFGEPLTIEDVELAPPGPNQVEVTLEACAICHSDISFLDGGWGGQLPAIYGHEAAGKITAVGSGISLHRIGDPVIVTLIKACGHCAPCSSGAPVACSNKEGDPSPIRTKSGKSITQAMDCGAFAEKVVVDQSQLAPIPEKFPMDLACLLACGVITGIGAVVNTASVRPGQNVVVIGAGGVGLNAIQGARIAGAARIVAIDMLPEKLSDAETFGATDTILASEPNQSEQLHEITKGQMADVVLVTVGAIPVYNAAPDLLAAGGKIIMVGMPHHGATASYDPANFAAAGQSLAGSKMGDVVLRRDIPWMIDLYLQGRLKLDELVSRRWSLDEINEAIADTKTGGARRNVIVFS